MRKNLACKGILSKLAVVVVFLCGVYEAKSSEDSTLYPNSDWEVWEEMENESLLFQQYKKCKSLGFIDYESSEPNKKLTKLYKCYAKQQKKADKFLNKFCGKNTSHYDCTLKVMFLPAFYKNLKKIPDIEELENTCDNAYYKERDKCYAEWEKKLDKLCKNKEYKYCVLEAELFASEDKKVREILRNACDSTYGIACAFLGKSFPRILASKPSIDEMEYYEKGCELGSATGCIFAGMAYLEKDEVQKAKSYAEKSIFYADKACKNGYEVACKKLEEFREKKSKIDDKVAYTIYEETKEEKGKTNLQEKYNFAK